MKVKNLKVNHSTPAKPTFPRTTHCPRQGPSPAREAKYASVGEAQGQCSANGGGWSSGGF